MSPTSETPMNYQKSIPRGHSTVTVLVALVVMLMFGFLGLEVGLIYRSANLASSVADATALAASNRIPAGFDTALFTARDIAQKHTGPNGPLDLQPFDEPNSGGDLEFGFWNTQNRSFTPDLTRINAVRTTVHFNSDHPNGSIPLIFGNFFGFSYANLSRQAVAMIKPVDDSWALFLGNDSINTTTTVSDSAEIYVSGDGVSVLASTPDCLAINGNGYLECTVFSSVGGITVSTENKIAGVVKTNQAPITRDELNFYIPPFSVDTDSEDLIAEEASGITSLEPGWYPQGLTAELGTYRLEDGTYIFGGAGITLQGTAQVLGENAIVVLDGTSGINLSESAELIVNPVYREHDGVITSMFITGTAEVRLADQARFDCTNAVLAENTDFILEGGQLTAGYLAALTIDARADSQVVITGRTTENEELVFPGSMLVK